MIAGRTTVASAWVVPAVPHPGPMGTNYPGLTGLVVAGGPPFASTPTFALERGGCITEGLMGRTRSMVARTGTVRIGAVLPLPR